MPKKTERVWWKIPKIWEGQTCYILGGGPSLTRMNLDLIKGKHIIGVNNAYRLGDWVDICWYGDCRWFDWHQHHLRYFPGFVATC